MIMGNKYLLKMGFLGLVFICMAAGTIMAQEHTVRGVVSDAVNGTTLPGVNVLEPGTTRGVVTNIDGEFEITMSGPDATLRFSFVGFVTENIQVEGRSIINVALMPDIAMLQEMVVVGYGTQPKSDLTGSVSIVNVENLERISGHNVSRALQGQVSGVTVQGSGEPGAVPHVKIRGVGSFSNTEPLYVVDGVPIANFVGVSTGQFGGSDSRTGGITDLNPSDIESIQILKDASAAAIYGARGANGVIIITTKRGKTGDLRINYEGSYGTQNIANRWNLTRREQYQELNNLSRQNAGMFLARGNNPNRPEYITDIDTDWQEAVFETGHITDHSLSLSGGTQASRYFASINFFDQSGTMAGPPPHYTRYSIRLNTDQEKGIFKFGQSIYYGHTEQYRLSSSQWEPPIIGTLISIPTVPVYDENNIGNYGGGIDAIHDQIVGNQVGFNNLRNINTKRYRLLAVVYGDLQIFQGLNYRVNLSYDRTDWLNHEFIPVYNIGSRHTNSIAFMNQWRGENPYMLMEHTLSYNNIFNKHKVGVLAGYTAQYDYFAQTHAHSEGFTEPYLEVITAGPDNRNAFGNKAEHTMISYLGRATYSYDDRYFTTINFRRDYSSRFGSGNKYGDFPSVSLGWKITSEDFLTLDVLDNLMLRAGYGKIGNENIGDYLYESFINRYATYVFGGTLPIGGIQTNIIDPSIRWEERVTRSIGFDAALLGYRIELSAEYYQNDANNILFASPVPWSSGTVGNPTTNAASMKNQGFEFSASYRKAEGRLHYNISANVTTLKNEVTKIGELDDPVITYMSKTEVGGSMGQLYGWVFDGIFQNTDEIAESAFQSAATRPGDVKFKDINDDGVINDEDRVYHGSAFPKLTGGLNADFAFMGFDLAIFFQGVYGNTLLNGPYSILSGLNHGNYTVESYENYWRGEGTSDKWPRPVIGDPNGNNRVSDRWFMDGSFLRLQSVQLGYTFNRNNLPFLPAGIESLRFYVSGQNLYTFTNYIGFDPDVINDGLFYRGQDYGSYPTPRTFLMGVKLAL
jgi:TonB-dependent starch-binding outer membrane protein SusC